MPGRERGFPGLYWKAGFKTHKPALSAVLACLVSGNAFAAKDETVQMAPTKEVACDKARGRSAQKATQSCRRRGEVKAYDESSCTYANMGKNRAATVKARYFCGDGK